MTKATTALKMTKADAVLKLLQKGHSTKDIREQLGVSLSYVHTLKRQLAEGAATTIRPSYDPEAGEYIVVEGATEETPEPKKETLGEKIARQTREWADAKATDVNAVLDKREEQYGSFMQSADTAVKIKGAIHNALARNDTHMFPDQMIALDMIALKISRIVNGNAAHIDSWVDIAGYAKLVADRLQGNVR